MIVTKTYAEPPLCEKEILRYAGCKRPDETVMSLLHSCVEELQGKLRYAVCYRQLPVTVEDGCCDFDLFSFRSKQLAKNLENCTAVVLFAATIGVEIDRLIARYGRLSPARALLFQAIGAERIEALCDAFCADIAGQSGAILRPRFSPGYGDLPLAVQDDIFAVLDCAKRIGVSLNESRAMSPSKSVTAFVGLTDHSADRPSERCGGCEKYDCDFRGVL